MKRMRTTILLLLLLLSLSGCGVNKKEKYESYTRSVMNASYLGNFDEYAAATGSSVSEGENLYNRHIDRLADAMCGFYSLDIREDAELYSRMQAIAKAVYEKAKFDVSPARQENGSWVIDITISPIDFLPSSGDKLKSYVEGFDQRIDAGEFNDITKEEYERIFASELLDMLEESAKEISYRDQKTVTVKILEGSSSYYISDEDLRTIDSLIVATE